jgi:hypothetical protein
MGVLNPDSLSNALVVPPGLLKAGAYTRPLLSST